MTEELLLLIIILLSIIAVIATILSFIEIHKKHVRIVKAHSTVYKSVLLINNSYKFHVDIRREYTHHHFCDTKQKFDKFNLYNFFLSTLENNMYTYKNLISHMTENVKNFDEYCEKYRKSYIITSPNIIKPLKIRKKAFYNIEKKLYIKAKLAPVISTQIICSSSYVSPAGRNRYINSKSFSFSAIENGIDKVSSIIEERNTREYKMKVERSKMSPSLRYDILKRDNFTCQICGATQQDGVKLHVDHIVPVAHGGKTEWSNLKTLCDRCNLGKSDKTENELIYSQRKIKTDNYISAAKKQFTWNDFFVTYNNLFTSEAKNSIMNYLNSQPQKTLRYNDLTSFADVLIRYVLNYGIVLADSDKQSTLISCLELLRPAKNSIRLLYAYKEVINYFYKNKTEQSIQSCLNLCSDCIKYLPLSLLYAKEQNMDFSAAFIFERIIIIYKKYNLIKDAIELCKIAEQLGYNFTARIDELLLKQDNANLSQLHIPYSPDDISRIISNMSINEYVEKYITNSNNEQ